MHQRSRLIATNRRRDIRRVEPQLNVEMDGASFRTGNWSLGGLMLVNCDGGGSIGEQCDVRVNCDHRGAKLTFDARVEIVRNDRDAHIVAAKFVDYQGQAFERLQALSTNRL